MSSDKQTTQDLVKISEDGKEGYAKGAEELAGSDRPELAATFGRFSHQRAGFSAELQALAGAYGETGKETGSAAAALHRGWMAVRDAVTGSGPKSVLKTALQGEDHAIEAYEKALTGEISPETEAMARRQLGEMQAARTEVQRLLDTTES